MLIQQKEIYTTMWKSLSDSNQETMIRTSLNKIDEFNSMCFEPSDGILPEANESGHFNLLNPLE